MRKITLLACLKLKLNTQFLVITSILDSNPRRTVFICKINFKALGSCTEMLFQKEI